jgi:hypothetical protein
VPTCTDDPHDDDPWARWWAERATDETLRPVPAERAAVISRLDSAEFLAPIDWHLATARADGYAGARLVCRRGDRALLAFTA